MPRSIAKLHIVEPPIAGPSKAIAPERRLRALFRKEARLAAELSDARQAVAEARASYARKHGLLMMPSLDTLRRLFA